MDGSGGDDILEGGSGDDYLSGGEGTDILRGGTGDDLVQGNAGDDAVTGGDGNDTLNGGDGNDVLVGFNSPNPGIGEVDTLSGGNGSDRFVVGVAGSIAYDDGNSATTGAADYASITDFDRTQDTIQLRGISSDYRLVEQSGSTYLYIDYQTGEDELVVFVQNTTGLNLSASYFSYVGDPITPVTGTTINGTPNRDTLVGTAGDDTINGLDNNDILRGEAGNDTLNGDAGNDTLNGGTGNDSGFGGEGNDILNGDAGNDTLNGGLGTDTLNGGEGNDLMRGGLGNDTYVVDSSGDIITEELGEGTDSVQSSLSYSLGANLENLVLTGSAAIDGTGNSLNNSITGNSANNTLTGGAGNDSLTGGLGDDTLVGGLGNETYVIDSTDVIVEAAGEGTDTVRASISYQLADHFENLTLSGTAAINGTGNSANNVLTGNSAANTLSGGAGDDTLSGGSGEDTLVGGVGNDTYTVNSSGDIVTEAADEGTDTVKSSISYTLTANVENLLLSGIDTLSGTGNALNNSITGNSANNTLNGEAGDDTLNGGTGEDSLLGGAGNDTYIVNSSGDTVTETADAGVDSVQASLSYTLTTNVENLILTGSAAINGTGNSLNNYPC